MSREDILYALKEAVDQKATSVRFDFKDQIDASHTMFIDPVTIATNIAHLEQHPESRMIFGSISDPQRTYYNIYEVSRISFTPTKE